MNRVYDLIIIGGGPAGIMAGISAKTFHQKSKILILEKNNACGNKLVITGKSKCNLTTSITDIPSFIEIIGEKKGRWIRDALNQFSVEATINFFKSIDVEIVKERGNRIFPDCKNAIYVRNQLVNKLKILGVEVKYNSLVTNISHNNGLFSINHKTQNSFLSKNLLISTGGLSYPKTGSTGDGYKFAESFGHSIVETTPALVGLKTIETWTKNLAGLTLKNIKIEVFQTTKKDERFGEMFFTKVGVSGPIIIDMSKNIHHLMNKNHEPIQLHLDIKPAVTHKILDERIQKICISDNQKTIKELLQKLMPIRLIPAFIIINQLSPNKLLSEILKEERKRIVNSLKKIIITLKETEGFENAIITAGGVELKNVNPKTMESKIIPKLFFAGELLDLDGPTGGYNLQIAWSTGFCAGKSIICN